MRFQKVSQLHLIRLYSIANYFKYIVKCFVTDKQFPTGNSAPIICAMKFNHGTDESDGERKRKKRERSEQMLAFTCCILNIKLDYEISGNESSKCIAVLSDTSIKTLT